MHNAMEGVSSTSMPTADDKARYEAARKTLIQSLQRKREVDRQLAQLEVQIYNFEGSYLSETAQHSGGNIIQGFDGYLKTQNVGRRRHEITDSDRVFSNSSMTYQKSLELLGDNDDHSGAGDNLDDRGGSHPTHINGGGRDRDNNLSSRGPTPGLTTVMLPPPTQRTQQELTAAQQKQHKKDRDKAYQRRKRENAARAKRLAAANASGSNSSGANGSSGEKSSVGPATLSASSAIIAADSTAMENDDNETISASMRPSKRTRVAE